MASPFELIRPNEGDAARITEIHIDAMQENPLLHAQFPTQDSINRLRDFLVAWFATEIREDKAGMLIARDLASGVVIGYAKWDFPPPLEGSGRGHDQPVKVESGDLNKIEGCRPEYLEGYAMAAEEKKRQVFGDKRCYQLVLVCIDPAYQGKGAGTQLTREVMKRAAADNLPVYLEGTTVAEPMYRRLGFEALDRFSLMIPRREAPEETEEYMEFCMVWYPGSDPVRSTRVQPRLQTGGSNPGVQTE